MARDDLSEYRGDVWYDVWRAGGNVDATNDDRIADNYYDGEEYGYAARIELESQRASRERMKDCLG